uniref:Putative secreted protein n=1 Tax=Anopheles triannulatus TaxID=58253 RepID=A0A2M4B408_9DIPT
MLRGKVFRLSLVPLTVDIPVLSQLLELERQRFQLPLAFFQRFAACHIVEGQRFDPVHQLLHFLVLVLYEGQLLDELLPHVLIDVQPGQLLRGEVLQSERILLLLGLR